MSILLAMRKLPGVRIRSRRDEKCLTCDHGRRARLGSTGIRPPQRAARIIPPVFGEQVSSVSSLGADTIDTCNIFVMTASRSTETSEPSRFVSKRIRMAGYRAALSGHRYLKHLPTVRERETLRCHRARSLPLTPAPAIKRPSPPFRTTTPRQSFMRLAHAAQDGRHHARYTICKPRFSAAAYLAAMRSDPGREAWPRLSSLGSCPASTLCCSRSGNPAYQLQLHRRNLQ